MQYKSIAVFCGSKPGNNSLYSIHAKQLGKLLAKNNITLIYGGGKSGLMGILADSAMSNHGKVIGIIPEILSQWELQNNTISELHIVADMHTRKKMMYELCDAAIILAGGNGTLDELFELITWNTLKIHEKRIMILNSNGYYNQLIAHLYTMQQEGFLHENWEDRIAIYATPTAIFDDLYLY